MSDSIPSQMLVDAIGQLLSDHRTEMKALIERQEAVEKKMEKAISENLLFGNSGNLLFGSRAPVKQPTLEKQEETSSKKPQQQLLWTKDTNAAAELINRLNDQGWIVESFEPYVASSSNNLNGFFLLFRKI